MERAGQLVLVRAVWPGGAIGAALTEAEAIREACAAIEVMAVRTGTEAIGDRVQ